MKRDCQADDEGGDEGESGGSEICVIHLHCLCCLKTRAWRCRSHEQRASSAPRAGFAEGE